jgi:aryl-alcohol dehydrogenase-like predicted oxidoreductase
MGKSYKVISGVNMTQNTQLPKRRLGKSEIEVSPIGLGVMQLSGGTKGMMSRVFSPISDEESNRIIQTALDGGINWFDTAEIYGNGQSEVRLSKGLKEAGAVDEDIIIETKWFPLFRTARNIPKTIGKRIQKLDGYTIDVYLVHQPIGFSPPEAEMDALADLVDAGKIKSVGVSNFDAERMRRAHTALEKRGLPLVVNQMNYSLVNRKIEVNGVLGAAKELGVTIVAYTPLGYGLLTGKYHNGSGLLENQPRFRQRRLGLKIEQSRPLVKTLAKIGEKYGVLPGQVALNWLITSQGDTVVAIPGATKARQVEESAGAMKFRMSEEDIARIDETSREFR